MHKRPHGRIALVEVDPPVAGGPEAVDFRDAADLGPCGQRVKPAPGGQAVQARSS